MADRTLYDVLEVSPDASPETIREAYARLSAKVDPDRPENAANPETRKQHAAVKEAFFTLGDSQRRKRYDVELERKWAVLHNVEVVQPFWNLARIVLIALALAVGLGAYYGYSSIQKQQVRLAKEKEEKAVAAAKAREEARQAELEAARVREDQKRQALQAMDERQRQDYEAAQKAERCQRELEAFGRRVTC